MNIATPAFLIILGILPGIIFFNTFFSGKFSRQYRRTSLINEFSGYIIFSIPFTLFSIRFFPESVKPIEDEIILYLFNGNLTGLPHTEILSDIKIWSNSFAKIYIKLIVSSFAIGTISRKFLWSLRLDIYIPLLRMKSNWYYELQGRKRDLERWFTLTTTDILTYLPTGEQILYSGVVDSFEVESSGENLKTIALVNAKRGKGRGDQFRWIDIPGDRIILHGNCIHSINISYLPIVGDNTTTRKKAILLLRSFFFEEP